MADDQAEIIARPPSHPVASTLLIVGCLGLIAAISFVWMELFGQYMPAPGPAHQPDPIMANHQPVRDHYAKDYGTEDTLTSVENELGLSSQIGDTSLVDQASDPVGGGAPPPAPTPDQPVEEPADEGGGGGG